MTRTHLFAWIAVAVWAAWLTTAQGAFGARVAHPEWVPDLALAFLIVLGGRVAIADMPTLACVVALARCAVSIDPPPAIFAALLGAIALVRALRSVIETSGPWPRTLLALLIGVGVHTWLALVHDLRAAAQSASLAALAPQSIDVAGALARAWPSALATALATWWLAPVLARLPGIAPLSARRQWHVTASHR